MQDKENIFSDCGCCCLCVTQLPGSIKNLDSYIHDCGQLAVLLNHLSNMRDA